MMYSISQAVIIFLISLSLINAKRYSNYELVACYGLPVLYNLFISTPSSAAANLSETNDTAPIDCIPRNSDEDITFGNETEAFNETDYCPIERVVGFNWSSGSLAGLILGIILFIGLSSVGLFFVYSCHSRRVKQRKLQANTFVSSNYIGSSIAESETGHCNLTISAEPYDIDDLCSLDNDNFLHSLESSIFANYMLQHHLHSGKTYTNPSTAHTNPPIHSDLPPSFSISQNVPTTPLEHVNRRPTDKSPYSSSVSMTSTAPIISRNSVSSSRTSNQPYHFHPHLSMNHRSSRHKSGPSSICSSSTISTTVPSSSVTRDSAPIAAPDSPPSVIKEIETHSAASSPSPSPPKSPPPLTPASPIFTEKSPIPPARAPVSTSSIGAQQLTSGYQQQNLHRVSSFPEAIPSYVVTV